MLRALAAWSGIHKVTFVLLGLLGAMCVASAVELVNGNPEPIQITADQVIDAPPIGKRISVYCENIDYFGQEVKGDDVERRVALCTVGDRLLPITLGPDTTFPKNVATGPLHEIRGSELWVRDGIRKDPTLARKSLNVYVDGRPRQDETLILFGFSIGTIGLWVWWIVAWRRRRERKVYESARVQSTFLSRPAPSAARTKTTSMPPPDELAGKIRFATVMCEITAAGLDARREDGKSVLVRWADVVRIVARRLPASHGGATFVDVMSTQGSTLRVLPWTRLTGDVTDASQARGLVELFAMRCPSAKLDRATQAFAHGEDAAQLQDTPALDQHDQHVG